MKEKIVNSTQTGDFLSALRKSKGLTQQEVAEQLGITNKTISKWERGDGLPDITMLPLLAEMYNITSDEILAGHRIITYKATDILSINQNNEKRMTWMLHKKYTDFTNITILLTVLILFFDIAFFITIIHLPINHAYTISIYAFIILFAIILFGFVFELISYRSFTNSIKNIETEFKDNDTYKEYINKLEKNLRFIFVLYGSIAIITLPLSFCRESVTYDYVTFLSISIQKYLFLLPKLIVTASIISIFTDVLLRNFYFKQTIRLKAFAIFLTSIVLLPSLLFTCETNLTHQQTEETLNQEEFENFIRRYLTIYNSYRIHFPIQSLENLENSESSWPELKYGVTKLNPDLLDNALSDSPRYDSFRNVTGFNYNTYSVIRRFPLEEQKKREEKIHTIFIPIYVLELFINCYFYYRQSRKQYNL